MDVVQNLQELGLTEYEARAYVALLQQPGGTGYEVSQGSGVPRSRIYEVLQSLVRKGAATATRVDDRLVYRQLPPDLLLARYRQKVTRVISILEPELARLASGQERAAVTALSGHEQALARVKDMCEASRFRLLVVGMPSELGLLAPELARAQERGVKVFVLSYGECPLPVTNLYIHPVTPLQNLQMAAIGRWLGAVSDHSEAALVLAPGRPEQATGIWGRNQGLVLALTFWIQHDVQLMEYGNFLGEAILDEIPATVHRRLLDMVMLEPGELGELAEAAGLPTAGEALESIRRRIDADPLAYLSAQGLYCFDLRGEGGGQYLVRIGAGGCRLETEPGIPDLTLRMPARDFSALVAGRLPPIALLERGRADIFGDLGLSSQLQRILRA
ncbi:MAG: helix-turn-helix domain-containing protein [Bacillota bacterium]